MKVYGIQHCCQKCPSSEVVRNTTWFQVTHWKLRVVWALWQGPSELPAIQSPTRLQQQKAVVVLQAMESMTQFPNVCSTLSIQPMCSVVFLACLLSRILSKSVCEYLDSSVLLGFSCFWNSKGMTPTSPLDIFEIFTIMSYEPKPSLPLFLLFLQLFKTSGLPISKTWNWFRTLILRSRMPSPTLTAYQSSPHQK